MIATYRAPTPPVPTLPNDVEGLVKRGERLLGLLSAMTALIHYWSPEALPFPVSLPNEGARGCGDQPPSMALGIGHVLGAAQFTADALAHLTSLSADNERLRSGLSEASILLGKLIASPGLYGIRPSLLGKLRTIALSVRSALNPIIKDQE
jgi:hypothetical protein